MDSKTTFLLEQIEKNCNRFNIPISPIESEIKTPNDLPFICSYMISLYIQSGNIGHQDLYVFLNGNDYKLVAVQVTHTTPTLLNTVNKLGQFYGVTYSKIEKVPFEKDCYYIYF